MMDISKEILLKMEVMLEGLRIDKSALEGVGTEWKEAVPLIFEYSPQFTKELYPFDIKFPLGSVCYVRLNPRSPFLARKDNGHLILEKNAKFTSPIQWLKRPKYYDSLTSDGLKVQSIIQESGECCGLIIFSYYCRNWEEGLQCRFCNSNTTQQAYADAIVTAKRAEHYGEAAAVVLEEKPYYHFIIAGGTLPGKGVTENCLSILNSIRRHSGLEGRLPVGLNVAPPLDLPDIDRLYEAGALSVMYDLEVWNRDMFKAICPGKEKNIGREGYLKALEYAVPIFGKGCVWSNFVLGLEEKENYYEAAAYLAERGIIILLQPWFPAVGSKLEGHRAPHPEWIVEVTENVVDIIAKSLPIYLTEDLFKSGVMSCYRCSNYAIQWDVVRNRVGGIEIPRENNGCAKGKM